MSTTRAETTGHRAAMTVLFAGALVLGSAEELVVGMLDLIATGLAVSVPTAGTLVTANALGLMLGGPLLAWRTVSLDRRTVLVAAAASFVLLTLVPVVLAAYPWVLASRVLLGAVQGLFIAAAITTATSLVPPERAGRAMALVISGFAAASALGMPAFTVLGQALGWRLAFLAVGLVGLVVLVASVALLPAVPSTTGSGSPGRLREALGPHVLAVLALCALTFGAIQAFLTYLVPFLDRVTDVSGAGAAGYLLLYGIAALAGSVVGGRLADSDAARTLVLGTTALVAALSATALVGRDPVLMATTVVALGLCTGTAPSLQHRVERLAGPAAPLAASLPASAVYAGIALGSLAGGVAIEVGGLPVVPLTGAALASAAVLVALATRRLRPVPAPAEPEPRAERLAA